MPTRMLRYKSTVFERVVVCGLLLLSLAQFFLVLTYRGGFNHFTNEVQTICQARVAYDTANHTAIGALRDYFASQVASYSDLIPKLHDGASKRLVITLRDEAQTADTKLQQAYAAGVINRCSTLH